LFGAGHEQGPTLYVRIQFHSVIGAGTGPTKTAGTTPTSDLTNLLTLAIELWPPLPVPTTQDNGKEGPRMVMQVVRVRLQKLVYKDVEWKTFTIFQEHIVAFQIRFVVHTVHNHTVPTQAFKEFFKHILIIQQKLLEVNKKPYVE
jgi:hypothetical protein